MQTITAIVLSKNEGEILGDCLKSLSWVDELIVVDDNSTNNTLDIAKKYTKNIIVNDAEFEKEGLTKQRNFAIEKATSEWVFFIDADERSTPEFSREIRLKIESTEFNGYYLPRKNFIFGRWIEHSDWYPDYQLHLFRKGKGKYTRLIHEQVELEGRAGYIENPFLHVNYQDLDLFLQKNLFRYSKLEAKILENDGYIFDWKDLIRKPIGEFLRRFFLKQGYLDGVHGLVACLIMATHSFTVYARIWEHQGFKNETNSNFVFEVGKEIGDSQKEINYWINTAKINEEKSQLIKTITKIKRKLTK